MKEKPTSSEDSGLDAENLRSCGGWKCEAGMKLAECQGDHKPDREVPANGRKGSANRMATTIEHQLVALWAVPRSISTAFERMFMERGDFLVFPEPFFAYYYYSGHRSSDRYHGVPTDPKADWPEVLNRLRLGASEKPVFTKNMAYHVKDCMSIDFVRHFTNTFIIRHPRYTLPSLYRLQTDFTVDEAGYRQQQRLVMLVEEATGNTPVIIDGEDLRSSPSTVVEYYCRKIGVPYLPKALNWSSGYQTGWDERWVRDVAASTGFRPPMEGDTDMLSMPEIAKVYDECVEIYEGLRGRMAPYREPGR